MSKCVSKIVRSNMFKPKGETDSFPFGRGGSSQEMCLHPPAKHGRPVARRPWLETHGARGASQVYQFSLSTSVSSTCKVKMCQSCCLQTDFWEFGAAFWSPPLFDSSLVQWSSAFHLSQGCAEYPHSRPIRLRCVVSPLSDHIQFDLQAANV